MDIGHYSFSYAHRTASISQFFLYAHTQTLENILFVVEVVMMVKVLMVVAVVMMGLAEVMLEWW